MYLFDPKAIFQESGCDNPIPVIIPQVVPVRIDTITAQGKWSSSYYPGVM
jgi:hypothetical protein